MDIQLLRNQPQDYQGLRQNEPLDCIKEVDHHLEYQINRIAKQKKWSVSKVRWLYQWVCKRVADSLTDRLPQIKVSIKNHYSAKDIPYMYDRLTQQDLEDILSCTSVDHIMLIVGISKEWLDVSYLEEFFHDMADPLVPDMGRAVLWLDRYKQLLQYLCCKVLLREAPGDHEVLQELLKDAETSLQSSRLLAVMHELDYKYFNVAQLLKHKECLEKTLDIPPGHLKFLRVEDGHSVAIYWLIDKRYIARVMFDGRWIFWPLLEHHVISLELVGSLTLSLKGGHVPYLIRDALLTGQDLIQQTEVIKALYTYIYPPCAVHSTADYTFAHAMSSHVFTYVVFSSSDRMCH